MLNGAKYSINESLSLKNTAKKNHVKNTKNTIIKKFSVINIHVVVKIN
jgi:hypothetical protein